LRHSRATFSRNKGPVWNRKGAIMPTATLSGQSAIPAILRRNWLLLGIVAAHGVVALMTGLALNRPFDPDVMKQLSRLFLSFVPMFLIFLAVWRFGVICVQTRPRGGIPAALAADLRAVFTDAERLLQGVFLLVVLSAFSTGVMFLKSSIPQIVPFVWDPLFADLDRVLHGGVDPYRLLLPVVGGAIPTAIINFSYHFWILMMYFCMFVAAFSRADGQRGDGGAGRVYVMTHVLIWIVGGNLMALVFSSAGPVYFERLGYGDTYAPLMAHLVQMKDLTTIWSLNVQDMVWTSYVEDRNIGISAMPSMHLATSTLMAIYAFHHSRWLGRVMVAFVGIILIGSVYLGWHYAIDSYAGIGVALVGWRVARWLVALSDRGLDGARGVFAAPHGVPAE
jgi:hypothetical protein